MMQRWIILLLALFSSTALAESTPAGLWRTIDDHTGKEKSLVRIVEVNGEFRGTIEKLFREPGEDPNPNCEKCTGDKKNKPVKAKGWRQKVRMPCLTQAKPCLAGTM